MLKAKGEKAYHRVTYDGNGWRKTQKWEEERIKEKNAIEKEKFQRASVKEFLNNYKIEWL